MKQKVLRTFNRFLFTVTFLVSVLCSVTFASDLALEGESDWTMFQYNAQHTGYNDKDSITVPLQLLWKKNYFPVPHWINPITAIGDRIIVTSDMSYSYKLEAPPAVRCVNAINGEVYWENIFSYLTLKYMDQASYYEGNVYVLEKDQSGDSTRMAEYDLENGNLYSWFLFYSQNDDQLGSIVYDNKLLFPAGTYNGIYCADLSTDEYLWGTPLPQKDLWSPTAYDSVVYSWNISLLSAHHIETGKYLWYIAPQYYDSAIFPNNVSEVSNDLESKLYNSHKSLSESESQGPPFNWSGQNTAGVIDTTIDMIFGYNHDGFFAVNYETKIKIWNKDFFSMWNVIITTPTICNGNVYHLFLDTLIVMDGLTGEEQWRYTLDTLTAYSTAIANGLIFISTQNKTIALDLDSHEKVWEYPAGGYLTIANNRLFIASITGDVYAFGRIATDIDDDISNELPTGFELNQNYPNPFNPSTEISFTIPEKTDLKLVIYNILGEEVRLLTDKQFSAGSHTITWDGTDNYGKDVTSGMYFYTLETEQYKSSKKMILLK